MSQLSAAVRSAPPGTGGAAQLALLGVIGTQEMAAGEPATRAPAVGSHDRDR